MNEFQLPMWLAKNAPDIQCSQWLNVIERWLQSCRFQWSISWLITGFNVTEIYIGVILQHLLLRAHRNSTLGLEMTDGSELLLSSSIIVFHWSSLGECNLLHDIHPCCKLLVQVSSQAIRQLTNELPLHMQTYDSVENIPTCIIIHWIIKCGSPMKLHHAWCIWPSVHLWACTALKSALPGPESKGMGLFQRAFF